MFLGHRDIGRYPLDLFVLEQGLIRDRAVNHQGVIEQFGRALCEIAILLQQNDALSALLESLRKGDADRRRARDHDLAA